MTNFKILFLCCVSFWYYHPLIALNFDLPESHLINHYANFPEMVKLCLDNENCDHKSMLKSTEFTTNTCWGYEKHCDKRNFKHSCTEIHSNKDQLDTFYSQADFGNIIRLNNSKDLS